MFTRILVPTDFSAPSDAALNSARQLAFQFDAEVHVLHVPPNVFLRAVVGDPRALEAAAGRQLQDRFSAEDRRRLHVVSAVERSDEPADEIVGYARAKDVDLIVMGTHGRSGVAHLLMGSVAQKVLRAAPCPVLTVHAPLHTAGFRRILVPTDFSAPSEAALDCARSIAERLGASLHLLHVLPELGADGAPGSDGFVAEPPESRAARLMDARDRLSARITTEDRARLDMTLEVRFGARADTIVDYAAHTGCDLIVMGTHGRTGIAHLLVGSVAERVVRSATCPVMATHRVPVSAAVPVPAGRRVAGA